MRALLLLPLALSIAHAAGARPMEAAEDLFRRRGQPEMLAAAMRLWETGLRQEDTAFESAHRLAHACYFEGTRQKTRERRLASFYRGIGYARQAADSAPHRPEGHFWLGVLNGVCAREKGIFKSLTMIGPIRESFEKAKQADPAYHGGAPDRALGRYYFELPGLLGGSKKRSLEHLRKALTYEPDNTLTLLYLGDTLAAMGDQEEARRTYQALVDGPVHPDWVTEDTENKASAREALQRL